MLMHLGRRILNAMSSAWRDNKFSSVFTELLWSYYLVIIVTLQIITSVLTHKQEKCTQTERDLETMSMHKAGSGEARVYLTWHKASLQGWLKEPQDAPLALEQPLDSSGPQGDEDYVHRCDQQHGLC